MYLSVSESTSSEGHRYAWIRLESDDSNIAATMGTYDNKGAQTFWINEELPTTPNLSNAAIRGVFILRTGRKGLSNK